MKTLTNKFVSQSFWDGHPHLLRDYFNDDVIYAWTNTAVEKTYWMSNDIKETMNNTLIHINSELYYQTNK